MPNISASRHSKNRSDGHDRAFQSKGRVGKKLFELAKRGDVANFMLLLKLATSEDVNYRSTQAFENEGTALMVAAGQGHTDIVFALVYHANVDLNLQNKGVWTALMEASFRGHIDIVRVLLFQTNIQANVQNNNGVTALMMATANNRIEVVKALVAQPDINVNIQNKDHWTALMKASERSHSECARIILSHPAANPNKHDKGHHTALIIAASNGATEVVRAILSVRGVKVNVQDKRWRTALMWAAARGHTEIVREIMSYTGVDISLQDSEGRVAADLAQSWLIRNLIIYGSTTMTSAFYGCIFGQWDPTSLLYSSGNSLTTPRGGGETVCESGPPKRDDQAPATPICFGW